MAEIGSIPIVVLALITMSLVAARYSSLALEATKPEVKRRRPSRKEVRMNKRLIAGSALETAWVISAGVVSGSLPSLP
jgi:hypothetical protein